MTSSTEADPRTLWRELAAEILAPSSRQGLADSLTDQYHDSLLRILHRAAEKLPPDQDQAAFVTALFAETSSMEHLWQEGAHVTSRRLVTTFRKDNLIEDVVGRPVRKIGLAPATKTVLENLDWFLATFEDVVVGDNFKAGETHHGKQVITVDALMQEAEDIDVFLLTTNTPDVMAIYRDILPEEKTLCISELTRPMNQLHLVRYGEARAKRMLAAIEAADNPLVVIGRKLLATTEPTFLALDAQGYDVFVLSLYDKMEAQEQTGWEPGCPVPRNALISIYEQLYMLKHLKKGLIWIYYDFYYNTGWDARNSLKTYSTAAAMMDLASRPVVLGMYDIIKPVCVNMNRSMEAFAVYKVLFDLAAGVALTSKSDHIAEYLRNTLIKDRPVTSFYRYSFPPEEPLLRLSDTDGERHLVGVTSFLGEVYEPNRIETRNSIRSILRQKIHFHYYSNNPKVLAFVAELSPEERPYFHLEEPIWDQQRLVHHMSRYDAGWLVGDEATIFARLISQVEDRHIRELYTLFVPNGVPTSSMTYGAAGLAVFISRQIKVMDEVYPKGCCIPLDMGEVDNLTNVVARLDWATIHRTMREERHRFDIDARIPQLVTFLNGVSNPK